MNRRGARRTNPGGQLAVVLFVVALGFGLTLLQEARPRLGLDLQGGLQITLKAKGENIAGDTVDQAIEIIRSRVDALGIGEPEITKQGSDIIQVQLPGVQDPGRAEEVIGRTAKLSFRPVLGIPGQDASATIGPDGVELPDPGAEPTPDSEDLPDREVVLPYKEGGQLLKLGPVMVEGSDVTSARATYRAVSQGGDGYVVQLTMDDAGSKSFKDATAQLACKPEGDPQRQFAIVLDHKIESAPTMAADVQCNVGISGGDAQITIGNQAGAKKEAEDLALVLRYGALPVELEQVAKEQVSPTVGRDSLNAGVVAGIIGIVLVALFAILYYRALGLVVVAGTAVFGVSVYTIVSLLGKTSGLALTLAGIAGIIVAVGITTDSYIVYFERIKDEVRAGKSLRSAIENGFRRAYRTSVAADIVSLLAATLLYLLAVSGVKGFAFFLGMATILDLLITYFFTRNLVALLGRSEVFSRGFLSLERAVGADDEEEE